MISPLLLHEIGKFTQLLIPEILLRKVPSMLGGLLISLIPYTPINISIFVLIFLIVYFTDIMGMGSTESPFCKFNKLKTKRQSSLWSSLTNSYYIYFIIAFMINYNTFFSF